jgi:RNA polymerase sigma factor (sigma-70 family)
MIDWFSTIPDPYGYAKYILRNSMWRDDAEDIVSECVIAMWRNQGKYNPNRGPLLYFMALTIRAEAFRLKKDNNKKYNPEDIEEVPLDAELSDSEGQVSDLIVDPRQRDIADVECEKVAIESLIDSLPSEIQKEIIKMRWQGYYLQEIGDKFGVSYERIRQIEKRSIECMTKLANGEKPSEQEARGFAMESQRGGEKFSGIFKSCEGCGKTLRVSKYLIARNKHYFCNRICKANYQSKHKKGC